ncbi:hypothetical protein HAX54_050098 [Datura stramonium]|uniref:Uncharacterized protein n=1 Tax=Datura stramonium TaxID=4076 RepID=A0ABS8WL26_DATST|nr:hypothetical protein [Datura stramonium]
MAIEYKLVRVFALRKSSLNAISRDQGYRALVDVPSRLWHLGEGELASKDAISVELKMVPCTGLLLILNKATISTGGELKPQVHNMHSNIVARTTQAFGLVIRQDDDVQIMYTSMI